MTVAEDRGVNDFIRVANKAIKDNNNNPAVVALAIESATSMVEKAKEGVGVLSADVEKLEDYISKLNKIEGVKS